MLSTTNSFEHQREMMSLENSFRNVKRTNQALIFNKNRLKNIFKINKLTVLIKNKLDGIIRLTTLINIYNIHERNSFGEDWWQEYEARRRDRERYILESGIALRVSPEDAYWTAVSILSKRRKNMRDLPRSYTFRDIQKILIEAAGEDAILTNDGLKQAYKNSTKYSN